MYMLTRLIGIIIPLPQLHIQLPRQLADLRLLPCPWLAGLPKAIPSLDKVQRPRAKIPHFSGESEDFFDTVRGDHRRASRGEAVPDKEVGSRGVEKGGAVGSDGGACGDDLVNLREEGARICQVVGLEHGRPTSSTHAADVAHDAPLEGGPR